ncbi:N-acetylmuramic acid 6-phosphate etherase [soil metagenome]
MSTPRPTEQRNPATTDIDLAPTEDVVLMILREERVAVSAAESASSRIAELADLAIHAVRAGQRIHYFGAGASGRLAVLDATELRPTFGVRADLTVAHFPGGAEAILDSTIDLEDGRDGGRADASTVAAHDIVIGVTASGTTRYVQGALEEARERGAVTALITSNPSTPLEGLADVLVVLDTGAEAVTGSTRLKAGTATKLALNAFSTAMMVGLGRTYSNLMIGMSVTNDKLRERAIAVLTEASGESAEAARAALDAAEHDLPEALVALLARVDAVQAREAIEEHGTVRSAVTALDGRTQ